MAAQAPDKVSVPELLSQLAETEKELEKVKVSSCLDYYTLQ